MALRDDDPGTIGRLLPNAGRAVPRRAQSVVLAPRRSRLRPSLLSVVRADHHRPPVARGRLPRRRWRKAKMEKWEALYPMTETAGHALGPSEIRWEARLSSPEQHDHSCFSACSRWHGLLIRGQHPAYLPDIFSTSPPRGRSYFAGSELVLSAVGKFSGKGRVTRPVAAHSVPRSSVATKPRQRMERSS